MSFYKNFENKNRPEDDTIRLNWIFVYNPILEYVWQTGDHYIKWRDDSKSYTIHGKCYRDCIDCALHHDNLDDYLDEC